MQEPSQQLCTVFDLITSQTGIPQSCQSVVVSEVRRRSRGLGAAASEIVHSWKARKSTQSLVLGLVNYMLLPQVVGRSVQLLVLEPSDTLVSNLDYVCCC